MATPGSQSPRSESRDRESIVETFPDLDALARAAASRIVTVANMAIAARGRFSIALSGGSTPRPVYELLARPPFATQIDWSRVHVFWGDERCVPPDHPESNYRMAREALLDHVPVPAKYVHRMRGEDEPHEAALDYEQVLRAFFAVADGPAERTFDLELMGIGEDGHTASLFPGTAALTEKQRWVVANHAPGAKVEWRITLTPVVLNAAEVVTFLVAGANKAGRVAEVLEGPQDNHLPVQRIRPMHGAPIWMLDAAAAGQLRRPR